MATANKVIVGILGVHASLVYGSMRPTRDQPADRGGTCRPINLSHQPLTWISNNFLYTANGMETTIEMAHMLMMTAPARHCVIRTRSGNRTAIKRSQAMAVSVRTLDVRHDTANTKEEKESTKGK